MRARVVGPMPLLLAIARRVSRVSGVKRTVMPWERFLEKRTLTASNSSSKSAVSWVSQNLASYSRPAKAGIRVCFWRSLIRTHSSPNPSMSDGRGSTAG